MTKASAHHLSSESTLLLLKYVAFIESAAIKIGAEDVLQVSSFGQYSVNGVSNADMPAILSGYPVEHIQKGEDDHTFEITLGNKEYLHVSTHKNLVNIKFELAPDSDLDFADSVGLMGSWKEGIRLARDGLTVINDDNAFGQEWQVRGDMDPKLFMTDRSPQYPDKCEMPSPKKANQRGRRLGEGISDEDAEKACAHLKEGEGFEPCVYDVLATQDLSVAQAGAY